MTILHALLIGAACCLVLGTGLRWLAAVIQLLINLTTNKPKGDSQ
ncbi:hypothetical protein [Kitasatospora viridis]|uniref:Uncharacterized protein n=1 Tax=Kitasatospora viridis TaxID=281105 RepID=A0A561UKT1_9ACTN|nr:hypothetical protein [Kitasatospora viridis]TWF99955.1 hypothetical protein FHX73_113815 [Kitasatospora viridis]